MIRYLQSRVARFKSSCHRFIAGTPGQRFQQLYRHRQQSRSSLLRRALLIAGGILVALAGVIFLFTPGPGIVVLLLGAALIAQQSRLAARAFDRIEIRLRRCFRQGLKLWRGSRERAERT